MTNNVVSSLNSLIAERDDLMRSIDDLEREYVAGDVDEADYTELRASYVQRAAAAVRAVDEAQALHQQGGRTLAPDASAWQRFRYFLGRRRTRKTLIAVAVVCVVAAVTTTAAGLAGVRLPGQTSSGSVSLPSSTRVGDDLTQAKVLASSGNLTGAISLYDAILATVPHQAEALTYKGWLERLAGIAQGSSSAVSTGDASIAAAVEVAPNYADARGFEVIILLEDSRAPTEATLAFDAFLKTHPTSALLDAIGPQMATAFTSAHQAVPLELKPYATK